MAQVTDTVLKSYFQTGDIPSEQQYVNLIDSKASIAGGQTNSGSLLMTGSISGTLDIHAKKIVLASGGNIFMTDTDGNTDDTALLNAADLQITFGDTDIPTVFQATRTTVSSGPFSVNSQTQLGNSATKHLSLSGSIIAVNSITASRAIQANGGLSGSFISASSGLVTTHLTSSGDVLLTQGNLTL